MKKILILIMFVVILTGCQVKYNVVINEDLTINEDAKLTGTEDFFNNYYKTTKTNVLKSMLEIYQDILDEDSYSYEIVEETVPYVHVTKKYNNVNEYINNSKLFNEYFDEIKYSEDGNIRKIETIGINENDPDNPERFNIKELEISITTPFKVVNHNAKSVNKKTNTYYYELNEKNDKILLEYNISKKFNPNSDIIIMIIVCVLIIIVSWTVVVILNKKKNN